MDLTSEEYMEEVTIGPLVKNSGPIELSEYDPAWPALYEREEKKIRDALGDRALQVEHTGSTSVPGLAAKPIIDITLVVEDTTDEDAYVPTLEEAGYTLRAREPDWHEHRLFKGTDPAVNLHTFPAACEEVGKMLAFRERLRASEEDRELYERTKRELAARDWDWVQHYADAKTEVVEEIVARARGEA
jgi:GrpB-like predicted nucleotidyltransferase (UPF0157 family)